MSFRLADITQPNELQVQAVLGPHICLHCQRSGAQKLLSWPLRCLPLPLDTPQAALPSTLVSSWPDALHGGRSDFHPCLWRPRAPAPARPAGSRVCDCPAVARSSPLRDFGLHPKTVGSSGSEILRDQGEMLPVKSEAGSGLASWGPHTEPAGSPGAHRTVRVTRQRPGLARLSLHCGGGRGRCLAPKGKMWDDLVASLTFAVSVTLAWSH